MHKQFATLFSAVLLTFATAGAVMAQTKLIIGQVSRTAANWPAFIASHEGFLKAEGLTPPQSMWVMSR